MTPADPLAPVDERKFLSIDIDNFDERMKSMKPRVAFRVPNTLTGEGKLQVDITFESMDDFSPAAVARKVDALNKLLEARTQLSNLVTYMDGKAGAEELIAKVLNDPALLKSLADKPKPQDPARASNANGGDTRWLKQRQDASGACRASRRTSSRSLLQKEFKPKTDRARAEVESAVRTLAEQALRETAVVSDDVVGTIKAIIAEIDKKLTDQVNLILHHERFQQVEGSWRGLQLPRQQHRNGRDAQDPGTEHLQEGSRQDAQEVQGRRLGSEPDLQEALRTGVWPARRRALRLPGRRLLLRPHAAATWSCSDRSRRLRLQRMRRSSARPRRP